MSGRQWVGVVLAALLFAGPAVRLSALADDAAAGASADGNGEVHLQARVIPLPEFISPEARAFLKAAYVQPGVSMPALDAGKAAWKQAIAAADERYAPVFQAMQKSTDANVEKKSMIGIDVYVGRPHAIAASRLDRAILYIHGGGFVMFPEGWYAEAMAAINAELCQCTVYSVNYRTPPDHPYPAPVADSLAIYRELLKTYKPQNLALAGESAGGNLVAATLLKARDTGMPLPAMAVLLSPAVDLTMSGDSFRTNMGLDAALKNRAALSDMMALYANGHDLKDPYLSPQFADLKGFPPTFIQSGTRDLLLSSAVLFHRALRRAGVDAELNIWEGMSHAGFGDAAPEAAEIKEEERRFLARHWGDAHPPRSGS